MVLNSNLAPNPPPLSQLGYLKILTLKIWSQRTRSHGHCSFFNLQILGLLYFKILLKTPNFSNEFFIAYKSEASCFQKKMCPRFVQKKYRPRIFKNSSGLLRVRKNKKHVSFSFFLAFPKFSSKFFFFFHSFTGLQGFTGLFHRP